MNEICFIPSVPKSTKDEEKIKIKMEVTVMSKADEMFKKLGYEKKKVHLDIQLYERKNDYKEIVFDLRDRTISVADEVNTYFDIKELQAINEKVKELRLGEQLNKEIKSIKEKTND